MRSLRGFQGLKRVVAGALAAACIAAGAGCDRTTAVGEEGARLKLHAPADQTLQQGETVKVKVTIERSGVSGEVALAMSELPEGVSLPNPSPVIPAGEDSAEVPLYASPGARAVAGHTATVTASLGELAVSESFKVTVSGKP